MKLTPDLKSLCSRIALERTRPLQRAEAGRLRQDAERVLKSGKELDAVQAWLQTLLQAALQAQTPTPTEKFSGARSAKPPVLSFRQ
jgi:hypothetical protein